MIKNSPTLVNVADYGIKGSNFYWHRKERYNVTEAELQEVGVTDGNAYVDESIITPPFNRLQEIR